MPSPHPAPERGPSNEQDAYNLGYDNPSTPSREWDWRHVIFVNAYYCGQLDAQNHQPRNKNYRHADYHADTFERKAPTPERGAHTAGRPTLNEDAGKIATALGFFAECGMGTGVVDFPAANRAGTGESACGNDPASLSFDDVLTRIERARERCEDCVREMQAEIAGLDRLAIRVGSEYRRLLKEGR